MTGESGTDSVAWHDLRASHEDRDRVVELLRVAAGDGRLTAEELDERLESALGARTYGELGTLVADLPAASVTPPVVTPLAQPEVRDVVRIERHGGAIDRRGVWTVPRRMEVAMRGGHMLLDFSEAVTTAPLFELDVRTSGVRVILLTMPGVSVDADEVVMHGARVWQRHLPVAQDPPHLLVRVTGSMRGGNIVVRDARGARRRRLGRGR